MQVPFLEIAKCCGTCKWWQYSSPPVCFNPTYRGIEGFHPQVYQMCNPENVGDPFLWRDDLREIVSVQDAEMARRAEIAQRLAEEDRLRLEREEADRRARKTPFILSRAMA